MSGRDLLTELTIFSREMDLQCYSTITFLEDEGDEIKELSN